MSGNNYGIASKILQDAEHAISEGTQTHGDTDKSFQMIGTMWQTYLAHTVSSRKSPKITSFDVAQMLAIVKVARSVYGFSMDNHVDAAGYAALAGMLNPMGEIETDIETAMGVPKNDPSKPI
jgi:Domain of unknown function (DUF6378)